MSELTDSVPDQNRLDATLDYSAFEKLGKRLQAYGYLLFITTLVGFVAGVAVATELYKYAALVVHNNMTIAEFAKNVINILMGMSLISITTVSLLGYAVIMVLLAVKQIKTQYKWLCVGFTILAVSYIVSLATSVLLLNYYITSFDTLASKIVSAFQSYGTLNLNEFSPWYTPGMNATVNVLQAAGIIGISQGFDEIISENHPKLDTLSTTTTLLMIVAVFLFIGIFINFLKIIGNLLLVYAFLKAGNLIINFSRQATAN